MTPHRLSRIRELFEGALGCPPDERWSFLKNAAHDDTQLIEEVKRLLVANDKEAALIDQPLLQPRILGGRIGDLPDTETFRVGTSQSQQPPDRPANWIIEGRYQVERELSRGGFGVVYLARDTQLHGRCVVVKVLYRATGDPWAEGKFRDESAALSRIDHPGVVAVLDCGFLPEGQPFLVMQYVEGVTLRSVLEEGPMPLGRFSVIVYQIGQALAAAHAVGVVHRDLKPENIMLQKKAGGERVRLIDFGIASLLDPGEDVHHTTIAGTLAYMSPEQLGGKAGQASDIWTLGAICYEALTGKPPFAAGSSLLAIAAAKTKVPDKPSCFRSELPPEADELILSALDHEPENRPVDPARFGESLANSLISIELPVVPLARRPWAKAVIYALVLMITTGAATWYWQQMSVTGEITHKQRSVSTVNPDVRLIVLHKNGRAEDVRVDSTFRVDDQFRIGSRAPEAGNYYVLSEDLEKRSSPPALTLLYPAPSVSSFVPAGQEVQIPAQSWFMFDEPAKQRLWLVWSREAVPLLEEQRKRLNRVEGGAIQDPAIRKQVLAFLPEWGSPKGNGRIVATPLIVTSH